MIIRRSVLLPLLGLLAGRVLAAEAPDYKRADKDWAKGPVRWLMSEEEEKEFKKLRLDEERAKFAGEFWQKRDPTQGTPANEFELIFWKKVEAADKAYKSITKAGCLTDMGKVFILLGPPSATEADSRSYMTWTYEPSELTGIQKKIQFRFAPSQTGQLLLDRKALEEYVSAHPESRGIGWKIPVAALGPTGGEVPSAPAREEKEDLSPESQRQIPILEAIGGKGSGPADVPFQTAFDFYAAVDGTTLTVVTVEAPREAAHGSGDAGLHPFARLAPAAADGKPVNLTGDLPFVPAPSVDSPQGSFVYQARHNLKPGTYKSAVVVEDKVVSGQMGTQVRTVAVPDYSDKHFDMSSLSMLAKFTPIEASVGPDESAHTAGPYVLGGYRVVPRAIGVLQKTEALSFYFQVYNPAPDPGTGKPNLEATYTFFLKEGAAWKPFRRPIIKPLGQVELYSIDLKDLLRPDQVLPAEFRMEAKVVDKTGGKEVKRELAFVVR